MFEAMTATELDVTQNQLSNPVCSYHCMGTHTTDILGCATQIRTAKYPSVNDSMPQSFIISPTSMWPRPTNLAYMDTCINQLITRLRNNLPVLTPSQGKDFGFATGGPSSSPEGLKYCHFITNGGKQASFDFYQWSSASGTSQEKLERLCVLHGGRAYTHPGQCVATCRGTRVHPDIDALRNCSATDPNPMPGSILKQFSPGRWVMSDTSDRDCGQIFKHMVILMTPTEFNFNLADGQKNVPCTNLCFGRRIGTYAGAPANNVSHCIQQIVGGWPNYLANPGATPGGVIVAPNELWANTTNANNLGVCVSPLIYMSQLKSATTADVLALSAAINAKTGDRVCAYPAKNNSINGRVVTDTNGEYICKLRGGKVSVYKKPTTSKRSNIRDTRLAKRDLGAAVAFFLAQIPYESLLSMFNLLGW